MGRHCRLMAGSKVFKLAHRGWNKDKAQRGARMLECQRHGHMLHQSRAGQRVSIPGPQLMEHTCQLTYQLTCPMSKTRTHADVGLHELHRLPIVEGLRQGEFDVLVQKLAAGPRHAAAQHFQRRPRTISWTSTALH
eukprot:1137147-Pelagomonas_calceolata.AAC.6